MADAYDLVVIGGGPGGYVAAIRAAQLGMKTVVVEREHLGGICLNWGCIPTKALLRTSEIYHLMHRLGDFGLSAENIRFDPAKVVARSRALAKQLSNGVGFLMRKHKITVVVGEGKLAGKGRIAVAKDGKPVADLEAKFSDEVCAVIIEPIQGEGGIYPVTNEFWKRARALATQHGAALIADEIQCGLGRTGKAFAYQCLEGLPDIVIVAKPLAGGLPLGALLAREEFAASFVPGLHGSTFGGGPLTCATGLTFLDTVEKKHLLANVRARGAELKTGLKKMAAKFDFIREVRGEGLIIGIDLDVDGAPYVAEALKQGLLINCTHDHILRLLPPFILTAQQVKEGLSKIESVLARTDRPAKSAAATSAPAAAHSFAAAR